MDILWIYHAMLWIYYGYIMVIPWIYWMLCKRLPGIWVPFGSQVQLRLGALAVLLATLAAARMWKNVENGHDIVIYGIVINGVVYIVDEAL